MKFTKTLAATAAVAAAGSIGFVIGAPTAVADATTQTLGSQGKLVDSAGNVVQGWTISNLKPSSDAIPHPVYGTLWEATAADEAVQGGVTPIVSNLNARARSGETYRVLFGAATPQGINPATLAPGEKTSGKVYFDVTGDTPDSVVYNAGGQDLLVWVQAPASSQGGTKWTPAPRSGTGSGTSTATTSTTPTPGAPTTTTPTPGAAAPAAAEGVPGAAATEGVPGAPLPTGSQGTPLPAGTPTVAPVPAGSQGTPLPAGSTAGSPQPASVQEAPAPEGSQGTPAAPVNPAAPTTTTIVPAPPR
ncbi:MULTISPECIES: MPT63 family protein [unclassified Mycobacterium]|uniref:MPT63 family protein n=1 Tax=unclassified Mycobacterium TaxID=2642494 RepID=UPI0029C930AA|nr:MULTISPECIES: DUF1942 domain-containing protein [unclassified Mycobacterium]